jgi:tetratricopeptide (TPR) repeat protein
MTTRTEAGAGKTFASTLLPWIIAGLLAVVYLLTMDHWLSAKNLQTIARLSGQTWTPDVYSPIFSLVSSPFRWLPEASIPLAINLFSIVCAFFVLVLLARCVALLPQDRTEKQRERQSGSSALLLTPLAWIPVALAVLVFGLQLTFWENATTSSSGMFDLVLFAYSVRCLLEYRVSKDESWLLRAAVVYAAAATDTWVMILLFPAFLGAVIWIKGLSAFQLRFLARLFLCFLAGLLFYLYLPLLHLKSNGSFWTPLKENLSGQFSYVEYVFRYMPHHLQLVMILTSLLPIIVIGIRWGTSFGDTSLIGAALATWIFHLTHAALLGLCIWAAFDPAFSLRDPAGRFPILYSSRDSFLPLYFLGAITIGYFSGYLLLVFGPVVRRGRRTIPAEKFLKNLSTAGICALLVLAPVGLFYKNIPQIKFTNGPLLKNYGAMLTEHLPPKGVLLSDNSGSLLLAHAALAHTGRASDYLFLDTRMLHSPVYYRFQTRQHPDLWPQISTNLGPNATMGDVQLLNLVKTLAEKHPIYYLQPSFGYYFEAFYPVPHGLVQELKLYPTNKVVWPPPVSDAVIAENETFWKQHDQQIRELLPLINPPAPTTNASFRQQCMDLLHIPFEKNFSAIQIGSVYSRALNNWGVEAQRLGRLDAAGAHFEQATLFYPENVVARANADFNQKLRKGQRVTADNPSAFESRFGKFEGWEQTFNTDGIFDEPTGCLAQGIVFARGRLDREAAQNFERTLELAPESLLARLWLGRVYVVLNMPEKVFPLVDQLRARTNAFADSAINLADVFEVELAATYVSDQTEKAQQLIKKVVSSSPPDPALLSTAARVSRFYGDHSGSLRTIEKQLELDPNNVQFLLGKAITHILLTNYNDAIPSLTKAMSLQPTNSSVIYSRAVAYFELGKLDDSQRDYEALLKVNPKAYPAFHGLGEIALRKKDTNAAIHFFEQELTYVPPGSPASQVASNRLKAAKTGAP